MQQHWDEPTVVSGGVAQPDPSGRTRARLVVLTGDNVGELYEVGTNSVLGRGETADIRLPGDGVSRRHARLCCSEGRVTFEDLGSTNGSFLNGQRVTQHTLTEADRIQLGPGMILKFTYQDALDEEFQRRMFAAASRDPLTGAYNRRCFLEQLESEVAFSRRHGTSVSLLVFDIDGFRDFNARYGHAAGDYVLAELAQRVLPMIRLEDVFARLGGEEFAVLSRGPLTAAAVVGERLRHHVEQQRLMPDVTLRPAALAPDIAEVRAPLPPPTLWQVTVSVGIEGIPNPRVHTAAELITAAEQRVLEAKRAGRNRVVCASSVS
ncbi:MAG: GGDEF domain-containing protein [Polyangiales bacterium]